MRPFRGPSKVRGRLILRSFTGFIERTSAGLNQPRRRCGSLEGNRWAVRGHRESGDQTIFAQGAAVRDEMIFGDHGIAAVLGLKSKFIGDGLQRKILPGRAGGIQSTEAAE